MSIYNTEEHTNTNYETVQAEGTHRIGSVNRQIVHYRHTGKHSIKIVVLIDSTPTLPSRTQTKGFIFPAISGSSRARLGPSWN